MLVIAVFVLPAAGQDSDPLRHLAPYLRADSVVVGRLDVANIDVGRVKTLLRKMGVDDAVVDANGAMIAKMRDRLLAAGAKHVYFTNGGGLLQPEALGVVPSNDAQAVAQTLADMNPLKSRIVGNIVLVGSPRALDDAGKGGGMPNPDWAKLLAKLDAYPSYAAFLPPTVLRRIVVELQPNLPAELGGAPMQPLVDAVHWGAVGVTTWLGEAKRR